MDDDELTRLKKVQAYNAPILEHVLGHGDSLDQEQPSRFEGVNRKLQENNTRPVMMARYTEPASSSFLDEEENLEELCQPQQRTDLGLDDSFYAPTAAPANPTTRTRLTPSGANNNTNGADGRVAAQSTAASNMSPNPTAKRADADNVNMNSERVLLRRSHEVTPGAIQMTGRSIVGRGEVGRLTPHSSISGRDRNSNEGLLGSTHDSDLTVQDAEKATTTGRHHKRIMIGIMIGIVLVVGVIIGTALGVLVFGRRSSQANEEIETNLILAQLVFDCEAGSQPSSLPHKMQSKMQIITHKLSSKMELLDAEASQDPCSPSTLAMISMSLLPESAVNLFIIERYALSCLYFATSGSQWRVGKGWLSAEHPCNWSGVRCSILQEEEGLVGLSLSDHGLVGTLPEEMFYLSSLRALDLSSNRGLEGGIPTALGMLTELLSLSLTDTSVVGKLPSEVGLLTELRLLDMLYLEEVSVPNEIVGLTSLEYLELSFVSGTSLPSDIGLLTKLTTLYLDGSLAGPIPRSLFLLPALESISLRSPDTTGSLPTEMFSNTNLKLISLREAQLSGSIPTQIGSLKNLDLFRIESMMITGTIPSEIGLCSQLTTLTFALVPLTGTIPTEIGMLRKMRNLHFEHIGGLSGTIPEELSQLSDLVSLNLVSGGFTRSNIPSTLCSHLPDLKRFELGCGASVILSTSSEPFEGDTCREICCLCTK